MSEKKEVKYSSKIKKQRHIFDLLFQKQLAQADAARQLKLSVRQIRRKAKRYQHHGVNGLISKQVGRPSNHKLPDTLREHYLAIVRQSYADFGPTFAHEKLVEWHQAKFSIETLRQWMIADGLWISKAKPKPKEHPLRPRRSCVGELVQIDGSLHPWFESRRKPCTLLAAIDDATSEILALYFAEVESAENYLALFRCYFKKHGLPLSLYTDKHAVFRVNAKGCKDHTTQFNRMMKTLGITLIHANSPQAKGRIERLFKTLQDRLVKELRLAGINDIEAGNEFLIHYRLKHNKQFAQDPAKPDNKHRPLTLSQQELEKALAFHDQRQVCPDNTISLLGTKFQLNPTLLTPLLSGSTVDIFRLRDGKIIVEFQGNIIDATPKCQFSESSIEVNTKTINHVVDEVLLESTNELVSQEYHEVVTQKPMHYEQYPAI